MTEQDNTRARRDAGPRAPRFQDLRSAGRELSEGLASYRGAAGLVVLGVVRGGAVPALEVARGLGAPLDMVVVRRLFTPHGPHAPLCAVHAAGTLTLDEELPPRPAAPATPEDYFIADALEGLTRRARACRGERPPADLKGKTVLLVDNGIHTGSTMLIAVRALRRAGAARIVAAVPVASTEGAASVAAAADELVCLRTPEPFGHVGLWYADFTRPEDEEIPTLLAAAAPPQSSPAA